MFADKRPGRYHAGIDLRTGGEEGWRVVAVGDGYVMRAITSYTGYGRALYLKLDDGRVAVYGHLQSFGPEVTRRVRAEQRRTGRYRTSQYFEKDAIRVRKGMIIARSGQTGAGAPHLHFEIRTADNRPLNPLMHGFAIADRRDPEIKNLWLIPAYENGVLGYGADGPFPQKIGLQGTPRAPLRVAGDTIYASGPVGLAVEAYDRKPNSSRRYNIAGLFLTIDRDTVFRARFDTLEFAAMAQIELERLMWLNASGDVYAAYRRPGNELSHSRTHPAYPTGRVQVSSTDPPRAFKLVVIDERGSRRTIQGTLAWAAPVRRASVPPAHAMDVHAGFVDLQRESAHTSGVRRALAAAGLSGHAHPVLQEPVQVDRFFADDLRDTLVRRIIQPTPDGSVSIGDYLLAVVAGQKIRYTLSDSSLILTIPAQAAYSSSFLRVTVDEGPGGLPVWRLGPVDLVLRVPIELSFEAPADNTVSLWSADSKGDPDGFVERARMDGRIVCTTRGPGAYTLGVDTTAPVIRKVSPGRDQSVRSHAIVQAILDDEESGVGNDSMIVVRIDGQWIPPEYDPETRRLVARPWDPMTPGKHTLEITVEDWAGNRSVRRHAFRVSRR